MIMIADAVIAAIKGILSNVCVICSMVCIALKVLDWYNPYMDFVGYAVFVPYILYGPVFLDALLKAFDAGKREGLLCVSRKT